MKNFKLYCVAYICSISINLFAQDLIINGSFNDLNICTEMNSPCAPSAWRTSISDWSDYKFLPKIEYAFFQVTDPVNPNIRSYLASRLGDTLIPGEKYHFSMDIYPNGVAVNSLGILFTDSLISTKLNTLVNAIPDIE